MITRPLDLAARLRPEPRYFHALFFVTAGLIGLCFFLFGSQFVLSPGLSVDFELPRINGARSGAAITTHHITVERSGLIIIGDGPSDLKRLREWLKEQAKSTPHPSLGVFADVQVPSGMLTEIFNAAHEAGFEVHQSGDDLTDLGGGR